MPERQEKGSGSWKPLLAATILVVLLGALRLGGSGVRGSGVMQDEIREVSSFRGVVLHGSFRTELSEGEFEVKLHGDDNILPLITTEVVDGVLEVRTEQSFSSKDGITAFVSLPVLNSVEVGGSGSVMGQTAFTSESLSLSNAGSGEVTLRGDFSRLSVRSSGSGNIGLTGSTQEQDVSLTGSADYQAGELECMGNTIVNLTGSGSCMVAVAGDLDVRLAGSGNVRYKGEPSSVNSTVAGSGTVSKLR